MGLDIRWPIGLMFSLIGFLLTLCGVVTGSNTDMYKRSLDININLYWGLLLLVFGISMVIMAWRGGQKLAASQAKGSATKREELASHK